MQDLCYFYVKQHYMEIGILCNLALEHKFTLLHHRYLLSKELPESTKN